MPTTALPPIREVFPDLFDPVVAPECHNSPLHYSLRQHAHTPAACVYPLTPSADRMLPGALTAHRSTPAVKGTETSGLLGTTHTNVDILDHADVYPAAVTLGSPDTFVAGKKRYICDVCGKRFERPSSLTTHMNSHTGNRPHTCQHPGCPKAFTTRSNMLRHYRSHLDASDFVNWNPPHATYIHGCS